MGDDEDCGCCPGDTSDSKVCEVKLMGKVTCPECSHEQPMEIPTNSCQAFYKCDKCEKRIAALKSCCVFCDYGDRKCPAAESHKGAT